MPSALIAVKDASGSTVNIEKPIVPARAAAADSRPVVLSNEDFAKLGGGLPSALTAGGNLKVELPTSQIETGKYEAFPNTVSTTTMLGTTGAIGDFLSTVTIVPETLNPGSISIKDGSGTAIVIFAGGTGSVLSLVPFTVNLGYTATGAGWQIVTGSGGNVHGVCGGNFT